MAKRAMETEAEVQVNGVSLHVTQAGPAEGSPLILLHGFPEGRLAWRNQIPALAEAGFRVIVPDQRGYGASSKPKAIRSYHLDVLARDVIGLAQQLGYAQVGLAGHDWGGIVAWRTAACFPERISRLAILNAPHSELPWQYLWTNPLQILRSWYAFWFQLPWFPEQVLAWHHHHLLKQSLQNTSRPGTFSPAALAEYELSWKEPDTLRSMVHWYRALRLPRSVQKRKTCVRTLILWGEQDRFLSPNVASASAALCEDVRLVRFAEATHWLQQEEPEQINALLSSFLAGS